MLTFTTELEGIEEVERAWGQAIDVLDDGIAKALEAAAKAAVDSAKTTHRYKDRSGDLTRSIGYRLVLNRRGNVEIELHALADYASYVEEGTAPHPIDPKLGAGFIGPARPGQGRKRSGAGGLLHWEPYPGDHHFARHVDHPGTPSLPFMGPALQTFERIFMRDVEMVYPRMQALMAA